MFGKFFVAWLIGGVVALAAGALVVRRAPHANGVEPECAGPIDGDCDGLRDVL